VGTYLLPLLFIAATTMILWAVSPWLALVLVAADAALSTLVYAASGAGLGARQALTAPTWFSLVIAEITAGALLLALLGGWCRPRAPRVLVDTIGTTE
jgi:hypothetical protein